MKHVDQTPYRSEGGEISIVNRLQGMLKYGMSWYDRVKAQDAIVAVLGRQLGGQFVLLQNILLPNTEIDLPLILIGPPGVFLINALHERGVFLARDDEWGTLTGDTFVPARINQVKRAMTMARVLQVYFDRLGYKGILVEPVVMSADPGLHVDSTRPAARVVMSDALDRFALSLLQARPIFDMNTVAELEHVILTGKSRQAAASAGAQDLAESDDSPVPQQAGAVFLPEEGGSGELEFAFTDEAETMESGAQVSSVSGSSSEEAPAPARPKKTKKPKQKKIMGLKPAQLAIIIALSMFLLCVLTAFALLVAAIFGWIEIQFV